MIEVMHHQDRPKEMIEDILLFIRQMERSKTSRSSFVGGNSSKKGIMMSTRGKIQ